MEYPWCIIEFKSKEFLVSSSLQKNQGKPQK
ncbi:hypothetical protein FWK35_00035827, partial [Aphis craccivora]